MILKKESIFEQKTWTENEKEMRNLVVFFGFQCLQPHVHPILALGGKEVLARACLDLDAEISR